MTSSVKIVLTEPERLFAVHSGQRRHEVGNHLKSGRYGAQAGGGELELSGDIVGCISELALAKHLCLPWKPNIGVIGAPDVEPCYQVRAVMRAGRRLLLHPGDKDHEIFVSALVHGLGTHVELRGWMYAHQAKRPAWWTELQPGRPCFCVPHQLLHSVEAMPRRLHLVPDRQAHMRFAAGGGSCV
jgi:hypothetical protein